MIPLRETADALLALRDETIRAGLAGAPSDQAAFDRLAAAVRDMLTDLGVDLGDETQARTVLAVFGLAQMSYQAACGAAHPELGWTHMYNSLSAAALSAAERHASEATR